MREGHGARDCEAVGVSVRTVRRIVREAAVEGDGDERTRQARHIGRPRVTGAVRTRAGGDHAGQLASRSLPDPTQLAQPPWASIIEAARNHNQVRSI